MSIHSERLSVELQFINEDWVMENRLKIETRKQILTPGSVNAAS